MFRCKMLKCTIIKCVIVTVVFCYFFIGSTTAQSNSTMPYNNFTFTYNMAMRCKEHLCQNGYNYKTFYQMQSDDGKPQTIGAAFEMHLAILAASNGHILLSPEAHPESSDPVYEIVVGGGANKFTELRRNLRRNAKASAKTVGILSPVEFRGFFIRMSEDGVIEIGREGDLLPLLSYSDVDPLTIKYFSFAAWNGVEAKFLYDCPSPEDSNATSPDSQEIEPKLSQSEHKQTLLMDRLPNLPPGPTVNVKLGVKITTIRYDAFDTKLTTGLAIVTSWTDDSMAWNPNKFNGTNSLLFRQGQIWRPTFFVYNSDDIGVVDTKNPDLISMVYSGEATFHFHTKLTTWCSDGTYSWPRDEYICSIIIGSWEAHEKISIEEISPKDDKMKVFAAIDDVIQNEWEITTKGAIVPVSAWNQIFPSSDNETHQSDRLVLTMHLKRRATSYNIVFYTPLLVLITFVLLSFWSEPLQMSRIWFYAASTVIICMGLCYIDYFVPSHTVPSILVLYITILMGILLALLIHIIMMTSATEKFCKTVWMQAVLTSKWFRAVFCLPEMKTCRNYDSINEGYATPDDDDYGVMIAPRNGNIEEMQTEVTKYGEKEELAEALDKFMFAVYSVVFAVMLTLHF